MRHALIRLWKMVGVKVQWSVVHSSLETIETIAISTDPADPPDLAQKTNAHCTALGSSPKDTQTYST
jgi:hypothetical protein